MRRVVRNIIVLLVAVAFGPLTSGYPLAQYLCAMNDAMPMACPMAGCTKEVPTGSTIASPDCCSKYVVAADISTHFVKTDGTQDLSGPASHSAALDEPALAFFAEGRALVVPSVTAHAPPLFLLNRSLLL